MKKEPINILIVEDNEAHIELARRAFESRAGAFNVTVARTLKEARTQLVASTPDLMFVDLTLPDGNGIELLSGSEKELLFPTIILTVSSDLQKAVEAIKAGASDYVIKSDDTFADLPHIAERALREWIHIAERKKITEELVKLRLGMERSGEAIFMTDTEGKIIYVNPAFEKLYGFSSKETIGKTPRILKSGTLSGEVYKQFWETLLAGKVMEGEIINKTRDGRLLNIQGSANPILDESGDIIGFLAIQRDITERKRVEEMLKQSHEMTISAEIAASMGSWRWDLKTNEVVWSDNLCRLHGIKPGEFDGKFETARKFIHPDDLEDVKKQSESVRADKSPKPIEYRIITPDGVIKDVYSTNRIILDDDDEIRQIVGVVQDITERKKAEEALRESEGKFESFSESLPGVVCIYDLYPDGHRQLLYLGSGLERLLGIAAADKIGKGVDDFFKLIHPEDLPKLHKAADEAREAGQVLDHEYRVRVDSENYIWIRTVSQATCREKGIVRWSGQVYNITRQKEAEEELRESEEKYRQLFATETDAIMIFDAETRQFLNVNDAAVRMYGYSREEFLRLRYVDITAEPEASEDSIKKILSGAPVTGITRLHKKKDGTILPVEISGSTFILKGRSVLCGIVRDITERKSAEDALRISEERFYKAFNSSPDAIVLCSLAGSHPDDIIFVNVNESFEKLSGYSREEVIGKRTLDVKIFWDHKDQIRQYELLQKYGRVRHEECVFRSKSGDAIIGDFSSEIFYLAGKHYGVIVVRDITASKAAEEALRESEEKYKGLVENIELGISLISPQMEILSLNRKMREWFPSIDLSKRPICYESYGDPPKMKEICSYCPVAKTLKDGNVHEAVSETPAGDETKNYRIISSPIKDIAGNIVAVIEMVEDVTEKLKLEKERGRADKLESIGILAGGIAHDFNNILAGLLGSVSRAKMDINPGSETYKALERAETASIRAERLTDQLLTFSKGGAPVKEKASVAELVRDTAGFALSGSNVGCEILIPDDTWEAKVDRGQISQVVQNLVMNAAQAMPGGGKIKISVENLRIGSKQRLPLQKGKYVKISVRDKGIGIPEDYFQKIFDPYFTTKQKGSGLGLATVYSIVKNHDGHIDVTSELGVGTTFDVYLPSTGKVPSKEKPSETKIVPGTGKVLVVDDEEIIRITLGDILTKIGYEVESASDGREAIELFKNERDRGQPFDIIILDLTIPGGMGGKEAIVKLREIDADVKAVVSSGYATDPVVATFKEYGFSGYLKKPYKASDLSVVLGDILQGESGG